MTQVPQALLGEKAGNAKDFCYILDQVTKSAGICDKSLISKD